MSRTKTATRTVSPKEVDLNLSRTSQVSAGSSTVTLGGREYPIGSQVGSSGLFVIGDPNYQPGRKSFYSSHGSEYSGSSNKPLTSPTYPLVLKGYDFEDWNWPVIRYSVLAVVCAVMIVLLGFVISLSVERKQQCAAPFTWWHGVVVYHIPMPIYSDSNNDDFGDLPGITKKISYLKLLGVGAISISKFLSTAAASPPSAKPSWDEITSYTNVNARAGKVKDLTELIAAAHENNIRLLLELPLEATSTKHEWFLASARYRVSANAKYKNFYIWKPQDDDKDSVWKFDFERREYYLPMADTNLALLNWTDHNVHREIVDEMKFWLDLDVDGFVIPSADRFYFDNNRTVLALISRWRDLLADYADKVIIIDSKLVKRVDLQLTPGQSLIMANPISPRGSHAFQKLINETLVFKENEPLPWQCWRIEDVNSWQGAALEMLSLMLPGVIYLTAGQEVGLIDITAMKSALLNFDKVKPADLKPMLWRSQTMMPYNQGSILNDTHIKNLAKLINTRHDAYALRLIQDRMRDELSDTINYNFRFIDFDDQTILFVRTHAKKDSFYFAANFGQKTVSRDWSRKAPRGNVVVDTNKKYSGELNLKNVNLEPDQALVFRVKY